MSRAAQAKQRTSRRWLALLVGLALACVGSAGCASWRPVEVTDSWTLYAKPGTLVDAVVFENALDPAFTAVEERMGPFRGRVRVHAWDGEEPDVLLPGNSEVQLVPGIGPARVRAYHVRSGANPFSADGVFLGTTDVGTIVHELVHARLAEGSAALPLWFEEGLASVWGDGVFFEDAWVVDGLSCWALRELRRQDLEDVELESLLALRPSDTPDSRANLLVHFVGWAIVFDLAREHPHGSWSDWLASFERGAKLEGRTAHARRRLEHTLQASVEGEWLERLLHPEASVRLATAKGLWKLRSRDAVDRLLAALEHEEHPEVRYALALNAFLAAPETRVGRSRWLRIRNLALPVLRAAELPDEAEAEAARAFYSTIFGRGRGRTQSSLAGLARFWEE